MAKASSPKQGVVGKAQVVGWVAVKEMGGDKKDLKTVVIEFRGGSWVFYACDEVWAMVEIEDFVQVECGLVVDAKAPGKNKFKVDNKNTKTTVLEKAPPTVETS